MNRWVRTLIAGCSFAAQQFAAETTFHRDVLPILQSRCQSCHRAGEIGRMPLLTYQQVRPWARAILEAVKLRTMPPWFAHPRFGRFANDPRLSEAEIQTVEKWVGDGAVAGAVADGPPPVQWPSGWRTMPDVVVKMPTALRIPAETVVDYQYVVLPLDLDRDRWVREVEIRPGDRSVVHHAVLYVRAPGSQWLRDAKPGVPFTSPAGRRTTEDILAIYSPGAPASKCPPGMAKKLPAGADLVLQMHYTSRETDASDQTQIGLVFLKDRPAKRILTLQMGKDDLRIPPGDRHYTASVSGTLPADALLVSLFPHMHLRGKAFVFDLIGTDGQLRTLLRVDPFHFDWQLNYVLEQPMPLARGSLLRWTGYFDNSANNPRNPDPSAEVTWGEQSFEEMMIGFFDVAVDPEVDKSEFFRRR